MNIIMLFFITTLMVLVMASCSKGSGPLPEPTPPPTPTPTPTFVTYTGTGAGPVGICADSSGNVWTANVGDNSVTKITQSGQMTTYPGTGEAPERIIFDGYNIWTCNAKNNSVTKVTQDGKIVTYAGTGEEPVGITFDGVNIWTCNLLGNSVTKVTQSGLMTTYTIPSEMGREPMNITFDGVNIWTLNDDDSATKISPNGEMTKFNLLPNGHDGITSDDTNVWVENFGYSSVTKISPTNGEMTNYGLGSINVVPLGIVYSKYTKCIFTINGASWGTSGDCSITMLQQDGTPTTWAIPLQNDHYAICSDKFGNIWVAGSDKPGNSVMKVTLPK